MKEIEDLYTSIKRPKNERYKFEKQPIPHRKHIISNKKLLGQVILVNYNLSLKPASRFTLR